jgi:DNA-directed RNA polymerase subunit RPC12/RpoP
MLKLDFDILHDVKDYQACWCCNNKINPELGLEYRFIDCHYCSYTLIFRALNNTHKVSMFDGINYNNSLYAGKFEFAKHKIIIEFPILLDECLETMKKLAILI